MNKGSVTIFAENKIYPTKHGYERFTYRPVIIKDGVVHTVSNKQLSIEGDRMGVVKK